MAKPDGIRTSLRPGQPGDREFLWQLHRAVMRDYVEQTWGWDESSQRTRFNRRFDPSQLQVVEREGQPIGFVSVRRSADEIFLASIEIAVECQNQGVGTQLVADLLDEANRLSLPVTLLVLKVNPARRLYERLGFRCVDETPTHFAMLREPVLPR